MIEHQSTPSNPPVKIHVAIPSRNVAGQELCGGLAVALWKMQRDPRYEVKVKIWPGFGVDVVRNRIVASFLASDAEFLLMLDDDIIPPDDLLAMTAHGCDIVGGLYYGWDLVTGPFIIAYSQTDDGLYARPAVGEVEGTGLQEMTVVGSGCMLLSRRVLAALNPPWFRFVIDAAGGKVLTPEDFQICKRAFSQGFKVWLDTDRVCGHIKDVDLRDVAALAIQSRQSAMFDLLE